MKYIFLILMIAFFACNNKDEKQQPQAAIKNENSKENLMMKAVALYPDSAILLENLLQYYSETGNYDRAIAEINTAIKRNGNNARLWDIRSTLYVQKGDTAEAVKSLEKAIDMVPAPTFIISLGALYAETKNPLALDMADALLIGDKAGAEKEAYFIKGLYYSYINQKEKAIPFFDKSISLSYTFMQPYLEKALALYDLGKYQQSADVLEKAITVQNNYDEGYYYLGRTYEKLNRTQDAEDAYRMALTYDPDYTEASDALAKMGVK